MVRRQSLIARAVTEGIHVYKLFLLWTFSSSEAFPCKCWVSFWCWSLVKSSPKIWCNTCFNTVILIQCIIMPTLPDYPGVSRIWHWSPALSYRSPNLPDKMDFWVFLCFSLKLKPFFSSRFWTCLFIVWFLGHFCAYLVTDKDYFIIATMKANFDSMYFIRLHIRVMF